MLVGLGPGMNVGPKISFPRLSPHGPKDLPVQHKDPYIPFLFDLIQVLLDHDRLPVRIGLKGPHIVINQGIQVLAILNADLYHPFTTGSLQRLDHHGPAEIINDLFESRRISRHMGFRDNIRKIEGIDLAVTKNLSSSTIYHKDLVFDRFQELRDLINQRRIFSQKQGIKIGDGVIYQFIFLETIDQGAPILLHGHVGRHPDISHSRHHLIVANIDVMRFQKIDRVSSLVAFVHQMTGGLILRLD